MQFNLSNQTTSIEEDAENKSYRPLPSGRISLSFALWLRWLSIPSCLLYSIAYSLHLCIVSILFAGLTMAYNELGWHTSFVNKNWMNAVGYGLFNYGATLVAGPTLSHFQQYQVATALINALQLGPDRSHIQGRGNLAIALLTAIISTTIHVQDFQDIRGDSKSHRCTLPMAYPLLARASVLPLMCMWTIICIGIWGVSLAIAVPFFAFATVIGYRFYWYTDAQSDETSYLLYNASIN